MHPCLIHACSWIDRARPQSVIAQGPRPKPAVSQRTSPASQGFRLCRKNRAAIQVLVYTRAFRPRNAPLALPPRSLRLLTPNTSRSLQDRPSCMRPAPRR
jgi:hypothetical protein